MSGGGGIGRRAAVAAAVACAWAATLAAPAPAAVVGVHPAPSWQTNGRVNAIVVVGSVVYLGGGFTSVRPAGAAPGTGEVTRNHVAAFSLTSGALLPWNPNASGPVRAIQPVGSTIFLGGSFATVGGHAHSRLAAVSAATGAPLAGFTASADAEVLALAARNGVLYVGGSFLHVDGATRSHLAAVSTSTGTLTAWSPSADADVKALALTADGSKLIAGGLFSHVGGSAQDHLAALSPATGATLPWATHVGYVVSDLATDASGVYVAGGGGGGNFLALSPSSGAVRWQGGTNGNVQAITVLGGYVYAGGHYTTYCGPQHGQHTCTTPTPRNKLLAVAESNGALQPWNPGANSVLGVFALAGVASNGDVLAGGDFTSIGQRKQQGFAKFVP